MALGPGRWGGGSRPCSASEALSHSEAFTADLVFIKDILGILGFVWSWHMVVEVEVLAEARAVGSISAFLHWG